MKRLSDDVSVDMEQNQKIETERLILRPFNLDDAPEVQRQAGNRAVADTTLNIPYPYEEGMAEAWIGTHKERFEDGKGVIFAVTLKDSGILVGSIGITNKEQQLFS